MGKIRDFFKKIRDIKGGATKKPPEARFKELGKLIKIWKLTIPKKKKCKKAKWLSEEALQIAEKRRQAKGKGEKEKYMSYKSDI